MRRIVPAFIAAVAAFSLAPSSAHAGATIVSCIDGLPRITTTDQAIIDHPGVVRVEIVNPTINGVPVALTSDMQGPNGSDRFTIDAPAGGLIEWEMWISGPGWRGPVWDPSGSGRPQIWRSEVPSCGVIPTTTTVVEESTTTAPPTTEPPTSTTGPVAPSTDPEQSTSTMPHVPNTPPSTLVPPMPTTSTLPGTPPPSLPPTLPETGARTEALTWFGIGFLLVGLGLTTTERRWS
jgi:hypothetical protein